MMRWPGRHVGGEVSALLDDQLDEAAADRVWSHVLACPPCRRLVERESWVKAQVAGLACNEPSARLLDGLYRLDPSSASPAGAVDPLLAGLQAWAQVDRIEQRQRQRRRRTGLALAGAGSVSAAVLGVATFGGVGLNLSPAPSSAPTTALTGAPTSTVAPARATVEAGISSTVSGVLAARRDARR